MLAAVRALVEQRTVEEDYSKIKYVFIAYLKNLSFSLDKRTRAQIGQNILKKGEGWTLELNVQKLFTQCQCMCY